MTLSDPNHPQIAPILNFGFCFLYVETVKQKSSWSLQVLVCG